MESNKVCNIHQYKIYDPYEIYDFIKSIDYQEFEEGIELSYNIDDSKYINLVISNHSIILVCNNGNEYVKYTSIETYKNKEFFLMLLRLYTMCISPCYKSDFYYFVQKWFTTKESFETLRLVVSCICYDTQIELVHQECTLLNSLHCAIWHGITFPSKQNTLLVKYIECRIRDVHFNNIHIYATIIQRYYRRWLALKKYAWNPTTRLGIYYVLKMFRQFKNVIN